MADANVPDVKTRVLMRKSHGFAFLLRPDSAFFDTPQSDVIAHLHWDWSIIASKTYLFYAPFEEQHGLPTVIDRLTYDYEEEEAELEVICEGDREIEVRSDSLSLFLEKIQFCPTTTYLVFGLSELAS